MTNQSISAVVIEHCGGCGHPERIHAMSGTCMEGDCECESFVSVAELPGVKLMRKSIERSKAADLAGHFDGMRVQLYESARGLPDDALGTVVGEYQPAGCFLWVRWDCEHGPRQMRWHEIRPHA